MGIVETVKQWFTRPSAGSVVLSDPAPAARPETAEIGDTGMGYQVSSGTRGDKALARRLRVLETNYQLYESRGYEIYDRMRRSDPKVAGLLRAMRLPILGAQVRIEPAVPDEADPTYERAVEIADFASDNLLHGLTDSWRDTLSQFLLYLCHGHAPFEIIWKLEDGKALIERFAYRPPSTISDVYVERGRIASVHQTTVTGTSADIPGEKLLWFAHEREGDDWRGTSLLRPMFKPWFAKEKLEILLLIAADRGNGTPVVIQPDGGWGMDDNGNSVADRVDAALAAYCTAESGYFDLPNGATFQLVTGNASIAELQALKTSFDQDMSNVAIAQILDLGKTETGSRALGRTMSDMFLDSLSAIAADVEDTLNQRGGPIEQLVAYNFADAADLIPRLRFASLTKLDLRTFAAGLYQCWQMGMPLGDEVWEFVRGELDLPARKEDAPSSTQDGAPAGGPDSDAPEQSPEAASSQPQADESETTASEHEHTHLAEGGHWRPLTHLESYVALDEISARLDEGKATVRERTQDVRDKLTKQLVTRALEAAKSGDPAKVAALASAGTPMIDALAAELRSVYGEYFVYGRQQVADELARQKKGQPVVADIAAERAGTKIGLAVKKPKAAAAYPDDVNAWVKWLANLSEVRAREIAAAVNTAAVREAMTALVTAKAFDAVTAMVTRASDEAALQAGLSVTQVMLAGRSAEAQAEREQIESGTYSAILDDGTCPECEGMDGDSTTDVDEALSWAPNPACAGGERCRCMVIFEYKEGAA